MCGIVGFVDKSKNKNKTIKKMADLIIHRGPDSDGYYVDEDVALGFRRLSIIDLNTGDQPIYNEEEDKLIFFNGEIYNYKEIKEELVALGHRFRTKADTEVILHGYEEFGDDILNKLRGMFTFVIYDKNTKELFGARDFYGIKPFYYYLTDDEFMYGSEIKSFLGHPNFNKELNISMLEKYLSFQYSVGTDTFFKNVYKLLPGHYFKYKDGQMEVSKYYEIEFEPDNEKSFEDFQSEIKDKLSDTLLAHKISDVEVGSFLSSGVDSSFIAASSNVDKTFTVGFENKGYDETSYAKELSNTIGCQNISKTITKEEYFLKFPEIQYYMDEPLADASAIALYFVANTASKHVKVSLSGEGADEIFGGYNIYTEPYNLSLYYKVPYFFRRFIGIIAYPFRNTRGINFLIRTSKKTEDKYIGNAFIFDQNEISKVTRHHGKENQYRKLTKPFYEKVKNQDEIVKMQYIDFNFWLIGDILLKADKMSMANSLEVRVPYLDKVLIESARKLPTEYKVKAKKTKYLFRTIANEVLEDKFANKKKLGFPVPIREWMKEDSIYEMIYNEFEDGEKFFNKNYILKLLSDHRKGKKDNSRKIWAIYSFLIWHKQYFKSEN